LLLHGDCHGNEAVSRVHCCRRAQDPSQCVRINESQRKTRAQQGCAAQRLRQDQRLRAQVSVNPDKVSEGMRPPVS
jgi:hypothetical protein